MLLLLSLLMEQLNVEKWQKGSEAEKLLVSIPGLSMRTTYQTSLVQ